MPNWGTLGSQTRDLWHRFFTEIQQPTAAFASGKSCPTIQFDPFAYGPNDGAVFYKRYDQVVLDGGTHITAYGPDGRSLGENYPTVRGVAPAIWQEALRRLMFPSQFFRFAQDYLVRLLETKPARDASIGAKMIWAVDASWWLNMMFAATNIYPTWIPNALALVLDAAWVKPETITSLRDLFTRVQPFASVAMEAAPPVYLVPSVTNPGEYDSTGLLRNLQQPVQQVDINRIMRLVNTRPWWNGIETWSTTFDGARAQREDPNMDANLLRAVGQHTFFQNTGVYNIDFFTFVRAVESDPEKQRSLQHALDVSLPMWLSVMSQVPYWHLVRAGIDSWRAYSVLSLSVSQRPGQAENQVRFPYTASEITALRLAWKQAEESQRGLVALAAQLQTMYAIVQVAMTGAVGRTQVGAVQAWYQFANYRYNQPRSWERGWEIQPMLMRLLRANDACTCIRMYPEAGGPASCVNELPDCDATPDVRVYPGGKMGVHADQGLAYIEQLGGFALSSGADVTAPGVVAFEQLSTPPKSLSQAPASVAPVQVSQRQSLQNVIGTKSTWKPLVVAGALSLVVGGIIAATRRGR